MKKQLIIIGILFILAAVGLSGCNEQNNTLNPEVNKFIGTWQNITTNIIPPNNETSTTTKIYQFSSDGTFSEGIATGEYEVKEGKLILYYTEDIGIAFNYTFSNNNQTLTLSLVSIPNESIVFTKQ